MTSRLREKMSSRSALAVLFLPRNADDAPEGASSCSGRQVNLSEPRERGENIVEAEVELQRIVVPE
jgi:hypothetical protein